MIGGVVIDGVVIDGVVVVGVVMERKDSNWSKGVELLSFEIQTKL